MINRVLELRVGEFIEIASEEEVLRTLDSKGQLDSLPFMPEMLQFCGKRFRVEKRAHKACDTIDWGTLRRMENSVHLEGVRCTGDAHGGCQAGCLIYWKEAWLTRASAPSSDSTSAARTSTDESQSGTATRETLFEATRREPDGDRPLFSCQATELLRATTSSIPWWDPEQYVSDIRSGNVGVLQVARSLLIGFFNKLQQANVRFLPRFALIHDGQKYPFLNGKPASEAIPRVLNLRPGDLVEVRTKEEIFETLDEHHATRGLRFDGEMLKYCGRRGKVLRRVEKIIDERTGRMLSIRADCIIIDRFICTGDYHRSCPRGVYPYWREDWLKRVE